MSKRLTFLAVVLTTVLTLMLAMILSTTALAAPDARYDIQGGSEIVGPGKALSDSAVILIETLQHGASFFLGTGALLVSGVFVVAYRIIRHITRRVGVE